MTHRRKSNWPALLSQFFKDKQAAPFDWKTNNCGFFACDWIAALTGIDPASQYRDKIDGALSAKRVLDAAGGIEAIADDACFRWGWAPIPMARAQRGDILSYQGPGQDGPALGVCNGEMTLLPHENGIAAVPTLACRRAWRIN